jgi:hypothetical protein
MLFNVTIKISVVVGHRDIQELRFVFEGIVAAEDSHYEISLQHVDYLDLPVFVLRILKYFFDCDYLSRSFDYTFVNFTESSLSDDLKQIDIVGS